MAITTLNFLAPTNGTKNCSHTSLPCLLAFLDVRLSQAAVCTTEGFNISNICACLLFTTQFATWLCFGKNNNSIVSHSCLPGEREGGRNLPWARIGSYTLEKPHRFRSLFTTVRCRQSGVKERLPIWTTQHPPCHRQVPPLSPTTIRCCISSAEVLQESR
jgi:hypothetical protein